VTPPFDIGSVPVDRGQLFLISGPCVIESEAHARKMAEAIQRIASDLRVPHIFKASYDKANRTSIKSFRGPGLAEGCRILRTIAQSTGLPVLTDVHTPQDCKAVSEALGDIEAVLQIPAFLCRQTDLLLAAGATGKPVNVKKGQWMHPEGMRGAVEKVRAGFIEAKCSGSSAVATTERGTFFGYGDLVVDYRSIARMRAACDAPVIFDATHSVQQPGQGEGGASGGAREYIPSLTLAACAVGVDGLFMETHPDPARAPSDGPNMMPLDRLDSLIERAVDVWQRARA
jgi:2-dehydro-3-deoxyphosphooctonate aldolase (KDO 8-P synthase)